MPDSAELDLGQPSGGSKGVPGWLMVVGAVAGVAGLVLLLKSGGGGGGTTAAGTSINATLGSIQEENMNLLGVTQAGFMQTQQGMAGLSSQMDTGFGSVNAGMTTGFLNTQNSFGALGTQIGAGFSNTNGLLGTLEHDIAAQLTAFSGQTQNNFNSMSQLIISGQASQQEIEAAHSSLLQSIQNDVQQGLVGQQQANGVMNAIQVQQNGLAQLVGALPNPAAFYRLSPADQAPYVNVEHGDFQKAATHWANDAAAAVLNFQAQNPQLLGGAYSYPGFTR